MQEIVSQFSRKKVLVIGDIMLDRYTSGKVSRVSPEAPVPVLTKTHEYTVLGGAGNVAANTASLGGKTMLCGVVGDDIDKKAVLTLLKSLHIDASAVLTDKSRPTTLKHRLTTGVTQLARFDNEDTRPLDANVEKELIRHIKAAMKKCDVVILSDYAKGTLTHAVVRAVVDSAHKDGKKVVADFKPIDAERFIGVDLIAPNASEAVAISGESDIQKAGAMLVKKFRSDVFITRGGEGISIFTRKGGVDHIPAKKVTVFDVTGAGDTVTAVAALSLAAGSSAEDAGRLANAAGQVVVQKAGTATVTREDLLAALMIHLESAQSVPKVWGEEKWLENNEKYCCKLLTVKKGYQCSLHYHKVKDEMFLITSGHIRLELGKEVLYLREGNYVRVPTGIPHRFRGLEDSVMIEISTHHDDEDSYRIPGEESRKVRDNEK